MKEQHTGEQNPKNTTPNEDGKPASADRTLAEAVRMVNAAIDEKHHQLETTAKTEEQEPIVVEGETQTGYIVRAWVDPKEVAEIMLEYDYPMYSVLGLDAPVGMWNALARLIGLDYAFSADI